MPSPNRYPLRPEVSINLLLDLLMLADLRLICHFKVKQIVINEAQGTIIIPLHPLHTFLFLFWKGRIVQPTGQRNPTAPKIGSLQRAHPIKCSKNDLVVDLLTLLLALLCEDRSSIEPYRQRAALSEQLHEPSHSLRHIQEAYDFGSGDQVDTPGCVNLLSRQGLPQRNAALRLCRLACLLRDSEQRQHGSHLRRWQRPSRIVPPALQRHGRARSPRRGQGAIDRPYPCDSQIQYYRILRISRTCAQVELPVEVSAIEEIGASSVRGHF